MNRRDFFKTGAALTLCSTVLGTEACSRTPLRGTINGTLNGVDKDTNDGTHTSTFNVQVKVPASVYDRALHFVYAGTGGLSFGSDHTDNDFLNAFDQVPGGVTMLNPFLLNVKNPSKYESMIKAVQAKGIAIFPGVGLTASGNTLNNANNQAIAAAYRQYTDCIRLENTQGYYDNPDGQADIQGLVDYCVGLGFKHIQLNPWPTTSGNAVVVPFTNPELDSTFQSVHLAFNHSTYVVDSTDSQNWMVNQALITKIQSYRPSINVLVNYESAPQHQALLLLETTDPGSSIPAMDITATQCETSPNGLRWCPPFTHIYDPLALGTWDWMANRLGDMPGSVNLQISIALTKTSSGYEGVLTVTSIGTGAAASVIVNQATLGSAAGTTLPAPLGNLTQNQSASVTLEFPASAGASKTATTLNIVGNCSGSDFSGALNITLP